MTNIEVLQLPRQAGKTTELMEMIHQFVVSGHNPTDALVVFPNMAYLAWWTRMWRDTYPSVPMPRYCSIQDTSRVRGLQVKFIGIEDIDTYDDGIWDVRLLNVWPAYRPLDDNGIVVATSSPIELNDKPYSVTPPAKTKQEILLDGIRKARQQRQLRENFEISAMMAKVIVGSDDKDLIDAVLSGAIAPIEAIRLLESKRNGH